MPLMTPPRTMKKQPFLYGMALATFAGARTPLADFQAEALAQTIITLLERPTGDSFCEVFADLITYTQAVEFKWEKNAPDEWRAFETFWHMVEKGDVDTAVRFYANNVANVVMFGATKAALGWHDAMRIAQRPYTPPKEWKPLQELTETEKSDPS